MSLLADWLARQAPAWLDGSRPLTPAQRRALTAIVRCRTPALGGHVYRCTSCDETDFAYHSCHHRACPRCGGKRTAAWTTKQESRLLPVPYFLVTFTVPEATRALFLARPETMYDLLFDCAARALQTIAAQPRHLGAELGFVGVWHTWGRQLQLHPHVHFVVPGGGLRADHKKWRKPRKPDWLLPVDAVTAGFRRAMDEGLRAAAPDLHAQLPQALWHDGWVREGAVELFAESVAMHPPLVAVLAAEDPLAVVKAGGVPRLDELRLHQGTTWRWNRAVYDATDGGHLRIEFRALPAGPTVVDMLANAAFLLGLTLALARDVRGLLTRLTFGQARRNFYAAARDGIDAELLWPTDGVPSPRMETVRALVPRLLPLAREGLVEAGVEVREVDPLLELVAERTASGRTGARWQAAEVERLEARRGRWGALCGMLERYGEMAQSGETVCRWGIKQS